MDRGSPSESFLTSNSLVSSPSAANNGARPLLVTRRLWLVREIALDIFHLLRPASVVHAERFHAAAAGNFIEAGFNQHEQCSRWNFLQPEFDKRGRLLRIVGLGID